MTQAARVRDGAPIAALLKGLRKPHQATLETRSDHDPLGCVDQANPNLLPQRGFRGPGLVGAIKRHDELLACQRDQNANDDDTDFARQLAQAVNWLRRVNVHAVAPQDQGASVSPDLSGLS